MKILLLDTSFAASPLYKALIEESHDVWVMGNRPTDLLAQVAGERWINQNYADVESVAHHINLLGIERLVPGCTDVSMETCVQLSCGSLWCDTKETNATLANKDMFRTLCDELDISAPKTVDIASFPRPGQYICKPVDSFSGQGITVFDGTNLSAFTAALSKSRGASKSGAALVETYVIGELYSCSGFLKDFIFEKTFFVREGSSANPYAVDVSYVVEDFPPDQTRMLVEDLERLALHLKLRDGLLHTQFIMSENGPMIIEVSRRCPGDLYSMLIEHSTGFPYAAKYVTAFTGEACTSHLPQVSHPVLRHTISADERSNFGGLFFPQLAPVLAFYPLVRMGEELLPHQGNRVGILFTNYPSQSDLKAAYASFIKRGAYRTSGVLGPQLLDQYSDRKEVEITRQKPLFVARPLLPKLETFIPCLEDIWRSEVLTNNGPWHQKLERAMEKYMGVPCAMLFNNGTVALLVALKLMDLPPGSEVITTPLTFAASAHAIVWNGLKPVFADVNPETLTIDPRSIEKAITSKTSAILAVHVYGTICDLDELQDVADRHGLRLVYDAAHAFGVRVNGSPIGSFGDVSIFSLHATKLFNTFEGGLITTKYASDREKIYFLRNFGIKNEEEVVDVGINGKMNEMQAAIGLLNLELVAKERLLREELRQAYNEALGDLPGIRLPCVQTGVDNSEQYYPLVIDAALFGRSRDDIYIELSKINIYSRKYFHPICTDFSPYKGQLIHTTRERPYVEEVKSQVLCLPFHSGVTRNHVRLIHDVFHR